MQGLRTPLSGGIRAALVLAGVLVLLFAGFSAWAERESRGGFESVETWVNAERALNPDGTVTWWSPQDVGDYTIIEQTVDGEVIATLWRVENGQPVEEVFRGSFDEAEAYVRAEVSLFTGTPAEADAWGREQGEKGIRAWRLGLTAALVVSAVLIAAGAWPGQPQHHTVGSS